MAFSLARVLPETQPSPSVLARRSQTSPLTCPLTLSVAKSGMPIAGPAVAWIPTWTVAGWPSPSTSPSRISNPSSGLTGWPPVAAASISGAVVNAIVAPAWNWRSTSRWTEIGGGTQTGKSCEKDWSRSTVGSLYERTVIGDPRTMPKTSSGDVISGICTPRDVIAL